MTTAAVGAAVVAAALPFELLIGCAEGEKIADGELGGPGRHQVQRRPLRRYSDVVHVQATAP